MNYKTIANVLGKLLIVTGSFVVFPLICSLYYKEDDLYALAITGLITIGLGYPLWRYFRNYQDLNIKDGFFIAFFGWILISAVSSLPFMIHGSIPSFTDAFFEMMSGYTTTGATILTDIEVVPHGLLFWRSQSHLLGGMGFLTLTIIFLPHGMGGVRIFRAESSPGQVITREKFIARNRDTMIWLWGIYIILNILETLLLCLGGRIGERLAKTLEKDSIKTKIIESDIDRCYYLSEQMDKTIVLHGDGSDQKLFYEENVGQSDIVISVTGDDETNILVSLLAKNIGVYNTITRIGKSSYFPLLATIGIEQVVSSRLSAVSSILQDIRK